jgi:hypothetical protein
VIDDRRFCLSLEPAPNMDGSAGVEIDRVLG